jgi:hypothetical protein
MITRRVTPNLITEAQWLRDDDYAYGALVLARAIGRAVQADFPPCGCKHPRAAQMRLVTHHYGKLIDAAVPGRKLAARRIVVTQDAADLAFA